MEHMETERIGTTGGVWRALTQRALRCAVPFVQAFVSAALLRANGWDLFDGERPYDVLLHVVGLPGSLVLFVAPFAGLPLILSPLGIVVLLPLLINCAIWLRFWGWRDRRRCRPMDDGDIVERLELMPKKRKRSEHDGHAR